MQAPLSDRAIGRWRGILPELGISASYLTGKHAACPLCGQGKDRFRFDNKDGRGTWICSKCGAGDGVKLVMLKNGWDFRETAKRIEAIIGTSPADKPMPTRTERDKRDAMNKLWTAGVRVTMFDPVGKYLHSRCGIVEFPPCLRYVASARYQGERASYHPAMLALMSAPEGTACILHRTYLTTDGRKATVDAPRRMMPGLVIRGSAVRLANHGSEIGIAEGIETAFSAHALTGIPCWAALNAGLLTQWEPPAGVTRVVIFADHDSGYAGQAAAYGLARRIASDELKVEVRAPEHPGQDWNDVHQAIMKQGCAA